ncbi:MAG: hypothetical protein Q9213_002421 [Squamulea squamosa]
MPSNRGNNDYGYDGLRGWRSYRLLRPGRGMYHDIKRRLPYYPSDLKDALTYRTAASIVRMYFVNLLPALAFILDMYRRTDGRFGVNEALFSSALAAMVFSIFGAQPLTIVGITGLISLFNYTIYDIIKLHDVALYENFMVWVGIWAAIFHWLFAICNICDYMRYVTDFSSESFGMYVGIIYIIKGVEELVAEFTVYNSTQGYLSCVIAILYFGTIYSLEAIGKSTMFRPWIRGILADYAFPIGTIFWNVSSITAQAKHFPLKKPGGFHWDFFLLGITTFISGILFIPLPNGLVPQAPVHTDSLTVYQTKLKRTTSSDGAQHVEPEVVAKSVVEQRVSHFVMGLAIIGTMTGPLLVVLGTMPKSVFAGVFLVVGWASIESNGILQRMVWLLREPRFVQPTDPLLTVRRSKIGLYLFWQALGVLSSVAISQTIAAIGFPVLIIALIPLRWKLLPKMFTAKELDVLDALTADNEVVLASLGGAPEMPEHHNKEEPFTNVEQGTPKEGTSKERTPLQEMPTEGARQRVGTRPS